MTASALLFACTGEAPPVRALAHGDAPDADLSCAEQHAADWPLADAPGCAGGRTCTDERGRFWIDGEPFWPRGLYNAGVEYERVLGNCPAGEPCEATTPAGVDAYLEQMAAGGFNLVQERSRNVPELLDALHANDDVAIAHLLWADPFTVEGHDAMVTEIEAAAADEDVVMWFGPDEVDLWDDWDTAAGIRRLLRGASPELDLLLEGEWAPAGDPYLPADEPAHDPHGLPFAAAIDSTRALDDAALVYDALMPTIYPIGRSSSRLDTASWGLPRVESAASHGVPAVPVLQMIGIDSMGLAQPSADQVRALSMGAVVHGAHGAFHYTYVSDAPNTAGRDGWYAPDDTLAWAAWTEAHALQDALIPVVFSDAAEDADFDSDLEWRRWALGARMVVLIANPSSGEGEVAIEDVLPGATTIRRYDDCASWEEEAVALDGYAVVAIEGW